MLASSFTASLDCRAWIGELGLASLDCRGGSSKGSARGRCLGDKLTQHRGLSDRGRSLWSFAIRVGVGRTAGDGSVGSEAGYRGQGRLRLAQPTSVPLRTSRSAGRCVQLSYGALLGLPIMAKNSRRVAGSSRKEPSMRLVTMLTPGLRIPRVVMHWCAASMTTATPRGFSTS